MSRINVYSWPDEDDYLAKPELLGWFDSAKADRWTDRDYNGNGSGGTGRGQAVYRTAQGRWVLSNWSNWQGEANSYTFIEPEQAQEWLLRNDCDDAVAEHFGEIEEERGPGRPKVGEQVCFTVPAGDLALIDNMAKQGGKGRSEVLRNAVAAFVQPVKQARAEAR
jgi:hypothetical protein